MYVRLCPEQPSTMNWWETKNGQLPLSIKHAKFWHRRSYAKSKWMGSWLMNDDDEMYSHRIVRKLNKYRLILLLHVRSPTLSFQYSYEENRFTNRFLPRSQLTIYRTIWYLMIATMEIMIDHFVGNDLVNYNLYKDQRWRWKNAYSGLYHFAQKSNEQYRSTRSSIAITH